MKIYEGMIIVTDLDGTFLGRGECVPERNLRAVAEFVEKGGRFYRFDRADDGRS